MLDLRGRLTAVKCWANPTCRSRSSHCRRSIIVAAAIGVTKPEPKPVHVPREPRRHVLEDVGPLVLVETRKDLSQLKLPFEQRQAR